VAAETRLSMVDGNAGELVIAGFPVAELAQNATFEETVWLLWNGDLPDDAQIEAFRRRLAANRSLAPATVDLLREAARRRIDTMDALLMATPTLRLGTAGDDESVRLVAAFPTVIAAYWHLLHGREPIAPRPDLGHAANYLYMLSG